jgi:hypothetical protein
LAWPWYLERCVLGFIFHSSIAQNMPSLRADGIVAYSSPSSVMMSAASGVSIAKQWQIHQASSQFAFLNPASCSL